MSYHTHIHTHQSLLSRASTYYQKKEESVCVCVNHFAFPSLRLSSFPFHFPLLSKISRSLRMDLPFSAASWSLLLGDHLVWFFPGKAVFSCSVLSLFDHVSTVATVCWFSPKAARFVEDFILRLSILLFCCFFNEWRCHWTLESVTVFLIPLFLMI